MKVNDGMAEVASRDSCWLLPAVAFAVAAGCASRSFLAVFLAASCMKVRNAINFTKNRKTKGEIEGHQKSKAKLTGTMYRLFCYFFQAQNASTGTNTFAVKSRKAEMPPARMRILQRPLCQS